MQHIDVEMGIVNSVQNVRDSSTLEGSLQATEGTKVDVDNGNVNGGSQQQKQPEGQTSEWRRMQLKVAEIIG
jgi:hypothetical protein